MRTSVALLGLVFFAAWSLADEKVDNLLLEARRAVKGGDLKGALKAADRAVELDGKSTQALLLRGKIHDDLGSFREAVADYGRVIELEPKNADAYNLRGGAQFKLGKIKESIDDFDQYLKLAPDKMPSHWQRGISYYYAGRYDEGRKQFEAGKEVFSDDVENAVWCYLCTVKTAGADKARASLLKISEDKRIPLMVVYALFQGKAKPEGVLKAVEQGKPNEKERKERLFYAHLYLGLWYDAQGDKAKTMEHMQKAAEDYKVKGYMCDVARVHLQLLRAAK